MTIHKDECTLYDVVFDYKRRKMKFALFAPNEEAAQEMGELQVQEILRQSCVVFLNNDMSRMIRKELEENTVIQFLGCNISKGY